MLRERTPRHPERPEARFKHDRLDALINFEGCVVAWCFGSRAEVLRSHDGEFELEVPDLQRNVPAMIGLCSSSSEIVDRKTCLLDPVVTCLARAGEVFDPPLRLRFPVGDVNSMESGSDYDSHEDADEAYRAYLESTYSALTREDAASGWVPIHGAIVKMEDVFVLEVTVPHFCDFALKQDINVGDGDVKLVELPRLKHKSRKSHFQFVNLGTKDLVVHYWGAARKTGFCESYGLKLGLSPSSGGVEVGGRRTLVDVPGTGVYNVNVRGGPPGQRRNAACRVVDGFESLTVVHTTQETKHCLMGSTFELVQVWGRTPMQHKHAIIFGDLTGSMRLVANLKVEDGVNVGERVKSIMG